MSTTEGLPPQTTASQTEPGSFRDRNARVFYRDGKVFRGLRPPALAAWQALSATRFFDQATQEGRIIESQLADLSAVPQGLLPGPWAAVLRHEAVPFVSYPYEWCFGMLKDAALLQLDLLLAALD